MTVGVGNLQCVKHACTAQWNILETTASVLKNIKEWRARKQSRCQEKKCFEWRYCLPQNHYILPNCAWEILSRHKSMWMMCQFSAKHTNCTAVRVSWKLVNWLDTLMGRFSLAVISWGFMGLVINLRDSCFVLKDRVYTTFLFWPCYIWKETYLFKMQKEKNKKKTKTEPCSREFWGSPPLEAQ